mmetsp:Transcript_2861/g.8368  ORF Transcript_2861/g.8368 Transcript_2861/m.8368 type:complete len:220 (-) Transcript_2861:1543-2202(-)
MPSLWAAWAAVAPCPSTIRTRESYARWPCKLLRIARGSMPSCIVAPELWVEAAQIFATLPLLRRRRGRRSGGWRTRSGAPPLECTVAPMWRTHPRLLLVPSRFPHRCRLHPHSTHSMAPHCYSKGRAPCSSPQQEAHLQSCSPPHGALALLGSWDSAQLQTPQPQSPLTRSSTSVTLTQKLRVSVYMAVVLAMVVVILLAALQPLVQQSEMTREGAASI